MSKEKKEEKPVMVTPMTWDDFRGFGLLWCVNRIIHIFGWAICVDVDDDGKATGAYPARVKFRGFSEDSEEAGFSKLSEHIKENIDEIVKETYLK